MLHSYSEMYYWLSVISGNGELSLHGTTLLEIIQCCWKMKNQKTKSSLDDVFLILNWTNTLPTTHQSLVLCLLPSHVSEVGPLTVFYLFKHTIISNGPGTTWCSAVQEIWSASDCGDTQMPTRSSWQCRHSAEVLREGNTICLQGCQMHSPHCDMHKKVCNWIVSPHLWDGDWKIALSSIFLMERCHLQSGSKGWVYCH